MSDEPKSYVEEFTVDPKTLKVTGGRFYEDGSRLLVNMQLKPTTEMQHVALFPDGTEMVVKLMHPESDE